MNTLKIFATIAFATFTLAAKAQTDKATTEKILNDKRFTFVATTAMPLNTLDINKVLSSIPGNTQNAGAINLNGTFDLTVKPDSLISYLPYYGRAFSAPYNGSTDSGYRFTSTKFDYTLEKRKRKGWRVLINTKDVRENPRLTLTVSESGYATLSVISVNRQVISYYGYLKEADSN